MFCKLTVNTRTNAICFCCASHAKDMTPVLNVSAFLVVTVFYQYSALKCLLRFNR